MVAQRTGSPSDQRVTVTDESDDAAEKVLGIDVNRLTGLEVAAAIRARSRTTLIVISGFAKPDDERWAVETGLRFVRIADPAHRLDESGRS